MKPILIFIIISMNPWQVYSQFAAPASYLHYLGTGTYSRHFTDVFSAAVNPASLAQIKAATAGACSEKRFMLKELSSFTGVFAFPFKDGAVGMTAAYSGYDDFNQSAIGLAYGRPLGDKADLGIKFNYNRIAITGYGNADAIFFEIGTVFHLAENLHLGCHLNNPFGLGKFGSSGEKAPSVYSFGLGYEVSDKILLSSEVLKEENQPVNIQVAIQYVFAGQFFFRGGSVSGIRNTFFGTGVKWKNIQMDLSACWHPQLGITPAIVLMFTFKNKDQSPE